MNADETAITIWILGVGIDLSYLCGIFFRLHYRGLNYEDTFI